MIPVLGVLVYNRGDLLARMVESIDYPVGKLVVVCNGVDQSVVDGMERVRKARPDAVIYNPGLDKPNPINLGCSGGWNWILKNHMAAWILLVGSDMQFKQGDLLRIADHYEKVKQEIPPVGMIDTNYGWNAVGITPAAISAMGTLDENFYPAYYEDCDFDRRHFLAQKQGRLSYKGQAQIFAHHEGSSTSRALPKEQYSRLHDAFARNVEYYTRKWGGAQGHEIYEHPFNNPALSIRDWTLEPGRWEMNKLL